VHKEARVQSYSPGGANVPDDTLPLSCAKMAEPVNRSICRLGCGLWWAEGSTSSIVLARWRQCALVSVCVCACVDVDVRSVRVLGVLQRLSLTYCVVAVTHLCCLAPRDEHAVCTLAFHVIMSVDLRQRTEKTRMWANAQRDGRPAEHRWRPLFNATQFG